MFDGAVIRVPAARIAQVKDAAASVGESWGVPFSIERFGTLGGAVRSVAITQENAALPSVGEALRVPCTFEPSGTLGGGKRCVEPSETHMAEQNTE